MYGCGRGPVLGEIRPGAALAIVAEAPGDNEVEDGRPLIGWSGQEVEHALLWGNLTRADTSLTNTILCQPPEDPNAPDRPGKKRPALGFEEYMRALQHKQKRALKKWATACAEAEEAGEPLPLSPPELVMPVTACRPRLERDLVEAATPYVLAVGKQALVSMAELWEIPTGAQKPTEDGAPYSASIKKQHGAPIKMPDGRILFSSYHPAMAARSRKEYLTVIRANIKRAAEITRAGGAIDWVEPPFWLNPSASQVVNLVDRMIAERVELTVDLETNNADPHSCYVRCVGFGAEMNDGTEQVMVAPFRHMDGSPWWESMADKGAVAAVLRRAMDELPLAGQNFGNFDVPVMLRTGLMTNRTKTWTDCYLEAETEFLTENGWKRFDDVAPDEKLATITRAGVLQYQAPSGRTDALCRGDILTLETQDTRCVVTGNHRMWVQPYFRSSKREGPWQFLSIDDVLAGPDCHRQLRAFNPAAHRSPDVRRLVAGRTVDSDFLRLLGLVISDGCVTHRGDQPRGLAVSQVEDGRASTLLEALRSKFQLVCNVQERREAWRSHACREVTWRLDDKPLACAVKKLIGSERADGSWSCHSEFKRLPPWALELSEEKRRALLEGLLAGDGSEANAVATVYRSASRGLADDVQQLAWSLGHPATLRVEHEGAEDQCFAVRVRPDLDHVVDVQTRVRRKYPNGSVRGHVIRRSAIGERIVCFTVPNETLVTRSRGKPAFHGNTLMLHHDTEDNDLPHDLGFIARRYFPMPMWKADVDHKSVDNVDDARLQRYCAKDVLITHRLLEPLRERVTACGSWGQYQTDCLLGPVLRDMGELGLIVDENVRGEFSEMLNQKVYEKLKELRELVAAGPKAPSRDAINALNPRSFVQLQELVFEQWGYVPVIGTDGYELSSGAAEEGDDGSTSNFAITELINKRGVDDAHEAALMCLLDFRSYDKLRGTYVDNLRVRSVPWGQWGLQVGQAGAVVVPRWDPDKNALVMTEVIEARSAMSLFNTQYKGHVVPTGRLSAAPAIQNWPALGRANMRKMIVAPPGHVFVGADYAQLEARIYAVMAQDRLTLLAIREDKDIHSMNAAALLAKTLDEIPQKYQEVEHAEDRSIRKHWRTIAKRFCFLELYGGEEEKLFSVMSSQREKAGDRMGELSFPELTEADVKVWHENWHTLHPETRAWHATCHGMQRQDSYIAVPTLDQRKRWFPGGVSQKNAVPNMQIQGFAASIANQALLKIAEAIPHRGWSRFSGPCLQVHDYIGCIVPESRAIEAALLIEQCMFFQYQGVPFPAEAGISPDWAGQDYDDSLAWRDETCPCGGPAAYKNCCALKLMKTA